MEEVQGENRESRTEGGGSRGKDEGIARGDDENHRRDRRGERRRAGRNVGWWDEECRECKNEVRKTLREWKKGRVQKEEYRNKKKIYKELSENKKEREREVFIREVGRVRTEGEIWEVIRKQRGGKKRVNEEIKEKEWKEYFMNLMGGIEDRVKGGKRKAGMRVGDELERGEVEKRF